MIDDRFYLRVGEPSAAEVAKAVGGVLLSGAGEQRVSSVAQVSAARPGDLCFLEAVNPKSLDSVRGGVCLVHVSVQPGRGEAAATLIGVTHPRAAFGVASGLIALLRPMQSGPNAAAVHADARIHPAAHLEPGCVIGPGAVIGSGSRIGAGTVIGPGVQIGQDCRIGARAVIQCALLGDGVILLSGVVIGESGFGLGVGPGGASLTPHFGRVIIQNNVSIGANATVDRGFLTDTVIGEGAQIDNLCHIAHNVSVGRHVVMAAFAGISGSVDIGDGALLGGRVGIADHVAIGAGAKLAAGSAVMRDVPAGETHGGHPAKPMRQWMRELAWLAQQAQKRAGDKS